MGNSKFYISKEAKDIIDSFKIILSIDETPTIIKLALAKGISLIEPNDVLDENLYKATEKWLVPENIIKEQEFLLFKHLIINEYETVITDKDINKYFAFLIEKGIRKLHEIVQNKTSLENIYEAILN
ncbi:hypothetical protein [Caryophanon latum]|uniref:Uncharacterized protein n=1 Tax=Caryophanon latum TaxID=33977 RepID=A0A1C0YJD8_9BACL|nr:hypothetical protein [Caryophanon latum]OCS87288.1 hypothetical protein A6K76_02660 [Caryophanon latum]